MAKRVFLVVLILLLIVLSSFGIISYASYKKGQSCNVVQPEMIDVSNVKYMGYMFFMCPNFNCDISNWDVRNVINRFNMFAECSIKDEYKPKF